MTLTTRKTDYKKSKQAQLWFSPQCSRVFGRCTHEFPHASCHSACGWTCCREFLVEAHTDFIVRKWTCEVYLYRLLHVHLHNINIILPGESRPCPALDVLHVASTKLKHGFPLSHILDTEQSGLVTSATWKVAWAQFPSEVTMSNFFSPMFGNCSPLAEPSDSCLGAPWCHLHWSNGLCSS